MENLPKNWVNTTAGELSEIIRGVSYKKHDAKSECGEGDYLGLRGGNIQAGSIVDKPNDAVYVDSTLFKEEQKIKKGDVVKAWMNNYEGKIISKFQALCV